MTADDRIRELEKERRFFRVRIYGLTRATGSDHTTACAIWGDNGQGGTAENFKEPLPCTCGALLNWERQRAEQAEQANARMLRALDQISITPARPFPDREAHSERVFASACWTAWSRIQALARDALSSREVVHQRVQIAKAANAANAKYTAHSGTPEAK